MYLINRFEVSNWKRKSFLSIRFEAPIWPLKLDITNCEFKFCKQLLLLFVLVVLRSQFVIENVGDVPNSSPRFSIRIAFVVVDPQSVAKIVVISAIHSFIVILKAGFGLKNLSFEAKTG